MEIEAIIKIMKEIYTPLIDFVEATDNYDLEFEELSAIFQYLINKKPTPISYFIPEHNKYNVRLLFLLFEKGFLKPDKSFLKKYLQSKPSGFFSPKISQFQSYYYLYPVMKEFIEEKVQKEIEKEILNKYGEEDISKFKKSARLVKMIHIFVH